MTPDDLSDFPANTAAASVILDQWGLDDFDRGLRNLRALAQTLGPDLLAALMPLLRQFLPRQADPDMALNNLERYLARPDARGQLAPLIDNQGKGLDVLLQLFSTSQFFSDLLVADPDFIDVVHGPMRRSPTLEGLIELLDADVRASTDDAGVLRAFRRFRQRQHLRIGVNDIIRDRLLEEITRDLSTVADAMLEVALRMALRVTAVRFGHPLGPTGAPARCVVMAFGKLGGKELNYSSDIDLMFIYDEDGQTNGKRSVVKNDEFYAYAVAELVRLLSAHTDRGLAYRVDLRLRPEGQRGALVRSLASTLSYYDTIGRTWERQALIKVRAVAGDRSLGDEFTTLIEGFVYRKYLSFAEINDIKAMKRRIENKVHHAGDDDRNVKTGHGGIRDIEFTIQFLQLLNGGDLPAIRQRGTLAALQALESAGCLTDPEYRALDDAYRFLRKTEHRLQVMFDWQTHRLPDKNEELRKLAVRMGYVERNMRAVNDLIGSEEGLPSLPNGAKSDSASSPAPQRHSPLDEPPLAPRLYTRDLLIDPLEQFLHDYLEKTKVNRSILDHLVHQTFADSDQDAEPEADLILAPDPDETTVRTVLARYPFKDVMGAYRNLMLLAQETGRFLSARRCRHFLASIAPRLLRAVAKTPDPDSTLINLEQVTASLGAKAILWELFSIHPASLKLYVDLCSNSPFLSQILINNPGMIDDLLDSLILDQQRTIEELRAELRELGRGVEQQAAIEPIWRSFQDKELLRIGVRDLLGKDDVRSTTAALSDLAEALLADVALRQEPALFARLGVPVLVEGLRRGQNCRYVLLALGKLGGREMSYHSDLDLVFVYEGEGRSEPPKRSDHIASTCPVDAYQLFTELAQQIIKVMSRPGPLGRLYEVDMRLRPTGKSGSLVLPLATFRRYYEDLAQVWELQSLTRARVVFGDDEFGKEVMAEVHCAVTHRAWRPEIAAEIHSMREKLENAISSTNLKRGPGGLMDVEFIVQMLQIKYGRQMPAILLSNTWEALDALYDAGRVSREEHQVFFTGYSFLRLAEARARIVANRPLNEYPETPEELEKYARRMGFEAGALSAADSFRFELQRHTRAIRSLFNKLMDRERRTDLVSESSAPMRSNG